MRTQRVEESSDIILKEHDKREHAHTDELVEDRAEQSHPQYLAYEEPDEDEGHDAYENVQRACLAHDAEDVVEHHGHEHDINDILYGEVEEQE